MLQPTYLDLAFHGREISVARDKFGATKLGQRGGESGGVGQFAARLVAGGLPDELQVGVHGYEFDGHGCDFFGERFGGLDGPAAENIVMTSPQFTTHISNRCRPISPSSRIFFTSGAEASL